VLKEGDVKTLRVIRIDPDQPRIGLSLRKVDSAAFADKDFKLLAAEFNAEEDDEPTGDSPFDPPAEPAEGN
jgi:small subunit ribosomal protein S1